MSVNHVFPEVHRHAFVGFWQEVAIQPYHLARHPLYQNMDQ